MIHNTQFYLPCVNYEGDRITRTRDGEVIREAADNDYNTSTPHPDLSIDLSRDGSASAVTHIFVKCVGTESYTVAFDGGTPITRTIPDTIINFAGNPIQTDRLGFQNDLFPLTAKQNASSAAFVFTAKAGATIQIVEIMMLNMIYQIKANSQYIKASHSKVDRAGGTHKNTLGFVRRYKRVSAERWKWKSVYSCLFANDDIQYDEFLFMLENNPNIVFAQEPSSTPHRIYPATVVRLSYQAEDRGSSKAEGSTIEFEIQEN